MNYIDEWADHIRSLTPTQVVPDGATESLFRLYALLALTKGAAVTCADVHNAWAVWMTEQDPSHESIRSFDRLSTEVREEDIPFVDAIKAAVLQRGG